LGVIVPGPLVIFYAGGRIWGIIRELTADRSRAAWVAGWARRR
jgi:hypothetical protein